MARKYKKLAHIQAFPKKRPEPGSTPGFFRVQCGEGMITRYPNTKLLESRRLCFKLPAIMCQCKQREDIAVAVIMDIKGTGHSLTFWIICRPIFFL